MMSGKKRFRTTGSVDSEKNYFIPRRLDWDQLDQLVDAGSYFAIYAPRQTGKTTAAKEYVQHLRERGIQAIYCTLEEARNLGSNVEKVWEIILSILSDAIARYEPEKREVVDYFHQMASQIPILRRALRECISFWIQRSKNPVVLLLDEVDSLEEDALIAFLSMIRAGHEENRKTFPQSIGLISMRYLKDYHFSQDKSKRIHWSPFNIVESFIRLPDFTREEVRTLYLQHTKETGQIFEEEALEESYRLTQGQPWLVNALGLEVCFKEVVDRKRPITKEAIVKAKDALILSRVTHIDLIQERLKENVVRNVIDAIIAGNERIGHILPEDRQYVRDLGLIKATAWEIANPIYQEVIPRILNSEMQESVPAVGHSYVEQDGTLNMIKLLTGFTQFYRENASALLPAVNYHESFPHLLLMAFLQRVINGGGSIHREYALGRKRCDLFIQWKSQIFVLEIKVKRRSDPLDKPFQQTLDYLDTSGGTGHLIVFDREALMKGKSWKGRIGHSVVRVKGQKIHLWRM